MEIRSRGQRLRLFSLRRSLSFRLGHEPQLMSETHALAGPPNCLTRLRSFIRELSAPAEFCLILLVGFGPLVVFMLPNLLRVKPAVVNNAGTFGFPFVELMLLIPVFWIGKLRGWSLSTAPHDRNAYQLKEAGIRCYPDNHPTTGLRLP